MTFDHVTPKSKGEKLQENVANTGESVTLTKEINHLERLVYPKKTHSPNNFELKEIKRMFP